MSDPNRTRMVRESVEQGMSHDDAEQMYDLGKHAFDSAWDAIKRVAETAPDDLRFEVIASAFASFLAMFRDYMPEQYAATVAMGADMNGGVIVVERSPE